jgi:hypothetical protein
MKGGIYSLLLVYLEIMYTTFDYLLSFHYYFLRQANQAITNIRSGRATMYFQLKLPTVRSCCGADPHGKMASVQDVPLFLGRKIKVTGKRRPILLKNSILNKVVE